MLSRRHSKFSWNMDMLVGYLYVGAYWPIMLLENTSMAKAAMRRAFRSNDLTHYETLTFLSVLSFNIEIFCSSFCDWVYWNSKSIVLFRYRCLTYWRSLMVRLWQRLSAHSLLGWCTESLGCRSIWSFICDGSPKITSSSRKTLL